MDWFNDLENRIKHIIQRGKNVKDILDVKEAFKIARTESRKQVHQKQAAEKQEKKEKLEKEKQERKEQQEREKREKKERQERERQQKKEQQLPTKAVTDIAAVDLWDTFGLKRETTRTQIWSLAASEKRAVSTHVRKSIFTTLAPPSSQCSTDPLTSSF
jgi:outer membrane biosynthesis protein TonB